MALDESLNSSLGSHTVVQTTGCVVRSQNVLHLHRHVVGRLYICGDDQRWTPSLPRQRRGRPVKKNIQVSYTEYVLLNLFVFMPKALKGAGSCSI